jgi:hypothetical protein
MAFKKRTPRHDWRAQLTVEEAREVKRLDKQIAVAREAMERLSPIRNRAIQRCRYLEGSK